MSKAPPIPAEQQGRAGAEADLQSARTPPEGAKRHMGENPERQGQGGNTELNAPRWGKTQDR